MFLGMVMYASEQEKQKLTEIGDYLQQQIRYSFVHIESSQSCCSLESRKMPKNKVLLIEALGCGEGLPRVPTFSEDG